MISFRNISILKVVKFPDDFPSLIFVSDLSLLFGGLIWKNGLQGDILGLVELWITKKAES